jgi:hypothetical protein
MMLCAALVSEFPCWLLSPLRQPQSQLGCSEEAFVEYSVACHCSTGLGDAKNGLKRSSCGTTMSYRNSCVVCMTFMCLLCFIESFRSSAGTSD